MSVKMEGIAAREWDKTVAGLPGANLLQTVEWAQIKEETGWSPHYLGWRDDRGAVKAAAMILERTAGSGFPGLGVRIQYGPRAPLLDWSDISLVEQVFADIERTARQRGAWFIKIDPWLVTGEGIPGSADAREPEQGRAGAALLAGRGWIPSGEQIQFRNTAVLDLTGDEDTWLARMKQKTRYNLRLAQKRGVTVRAGTEMDYGRMYRMYAETSIRDGFVIRTESYYRRAWDTFTRGGMGFPILAEVEGEVVAGLFLVVYAGWAWYLYGMSRDQHRERMPNYLLQWEAMRLARAHGALHYDLWGAPDTFDESDPMWGVFRFKDGLGARVYRSEGAWDFPIRRNGYVLYTRLLPRILDVLRRRGKEHTRREVLV